MPHLPPALCLITQVGRFILAPLRPPLGHTILSLEIILAQLIATRIAIFTEELTNVVATPTKVANTTADITMADVIITEVVTNNMETTFHDLVAILHTTHNIVIKDPARIMADADLSQLTLGSTSYQTLTEILI